MNENLIKLITSAINTYLQLDPESERRLKRLHGHTISIELLPFHLTFNCHFTKEGMQINSGHTESVHTRIRGTPLQLLGVALAKQNRHKFFADDVSIEGDAELGQQVIDLFDQIHIDWEEHLAQLIGDTPAYRLSQLRRKAGKWLHHINHTLTENTREYIQEEAKWLPTREELNDYFTDIDELRMEADRMEAKLAQLRAHIEEQR